MKGMIPRPIFLYLKIPIEVLLSKITDPNRQYSSQVFRFEESIHVLFLQANFSLNNFHFPVESSVFKILIHVCVLGLNMCPVSSLSKD